MSKHKTFDFDQVDRYSLKDRSSKVRVDEMATAFSGVSISDFFNSLPNLLGSRDLRILADRILNARQKQKPIIWGIGGHVIKVGLAPVLIDLMNRGLATAFAGNGSAAIHDFELGFAGQTSEDVDESLGTGRFGMAEETGSLLNRAIEKGAAAGKGLGEALGEMMDEEPFDHAEHSLVLQAYLQGVPFTVHLAIGTDIIHGHPEASGAALGAASHTDFRIFTQQVAELSQGGVYLNIGSAVVLPEVFLKAVSVVRSTSRELENFTTANLDFIQHYRPLQNVVKRPVSKSGLGISLTGHHEIMVPLLAARLLSLSQT
jgi:hypothetical protein